MKKVHKNSAIIASLTILTFFISTALVEITGNKAYIILVKTYIVISLALLIPTIIITGITGNKLAQGRESVKIIQKKLLRTKIIAGNGIFILVPAAFLLWNLSANSDYGTFFIVIQLLEFIAAGTNITLMTFNMKDGMCLAKKPRGN